jgi:hypothetical protein
MSATCSHHAGYAQTGPLDRSAAWHPPTPFGADVVARALATGARIVITGRVSDPSLFLAPALHEFGWRYDDWPRLAAGLVAAISSSAPRKSTAAASPIPEKRKSGTWPRSATRSAISPPTAA